MSDLGLPPTSEQRAPAGHPSATVPLWAIVIVVALILVGGGFAARMLLSDGGDAKEPSYPKAWDARVLPYVKIAQKQRGLIFLHPVAVRFLPPRAFEKSVTSDEKELDDQDRTEIRQFTGLMRAFGLISGDVDLFAAFNDVSGAGTLAYYSFDDKRITVRGKRITPAVRSTLVHELTHVLQDQHFDVGDRLKKLRASHDASTTEASVLDAIVEGDAQRVETRYRSSLTAKQRRALDAGRQGESTQASARIKKIPKVVVSMVSSPYTLGEGLVSAVAQDGQNAAVDKLLRNPPRHESSLLDPFEVLSGDTEATKVDVPDLKDGEKKFDSGEFGVLTWYFMLAERLPLQDALAAADGWGGDAYVAFERDGRTCARIHYAGDTARDTARMRTALQRWAAGSPRSSAAVSRAGDLVRFESCDPGTTAHGGKDASQHAIDLVAARAFIGIGLLQGGVPEGAARCLAGRLAQEYPVSKLIDPSFGANDPSVKARVQQLAVGCRGA